MGSVLSASTLWTLTNALLPQAIENDRLVYLAELVMRSCAENAALLPHLPPQLSGTALALTSATMHVEKHIVG